MCSSVGHIPTVPSSTAAKHGLALELSIFRLGIIQCVMEATALFSTQRRIDNQSCHRREIAQLQQVHGYFEIPIELTDFALEIAQPRACALQPLVGAHNSDVIPHQTSDLVPIMINHDHFI